MGVKGCAAYPLNVAAQRAWHDSRFPPPPPHPAPEIPARYASDEDMARCLAARRLRVLAAKHDWSVTPTYARGWTLPITRSGAKCTSKLIESIALRMRRVSRGVQHAAVGVWETTEVGGAYSFDEGWFWPVAATPDEQEWPIMVNATMLRKIIGSDDVRAALRAAEGDQPVLPAFVPTALAA